MASALISGSSPAFCMASSRSRANWAFHAFIRSGRLSTSFAPAPRRYTLTVSYWRESSSSVTPVMLTGRALHRENATVAGKTKRLPRQLYETELYRLQGELVKMQEWTRSAGARIVVIFEGRDAAGKGSTIKRVTEY